MTADAPDAPALADKVSATSIAFARTGDPNTLEAAALAGLRTRSRRPTMVFNNVSTVENDPLREQRLAMFGAISEQ